MEFIASKKIVHLDLAARNVLLTSEKRAKITDFGLSRRMYDYTNYIKKEQEPLPWRWMAPESLRRLEFTEKSDVWAYGVTLWEIFELGDEPYQGLSWDVNFSNKLERGLKLGEPTYNREGMYTVMLSCWNINPQGRPTFAELSSYLAHGLDQCQATSTGQISASFEKSIEESPIPGPIAATCEIQEHPSQGYEVEANIPTFLEGLKERLRVGWAWLLSAFILILIVLIILVITFLSSAKSPAVGRPRNCEDIQRNLQCDSTSGIYTVFPFESTESIMHDFGVQVYCDMITDGGGWTVFQRRRPPISKTVDFYRSWKAYADGFKGSSMADSHWLGLNVISELTKSGEHTLRIELTDWNNTARFAEYRSFRVANETDNFKLRVSGFKGNAGNSLAYHNGMDFSAKDRDNDGWHSHCALESRRGGWWYNACGRSNLNGLYLENGINASLKHVIWDHWLGEYYSLKTTEMKFRSKTFRGLGAC